MLILINYRLVPTREERVQGEKEKREFEGLKEAALKLLDFGLIRVEPN